MKKTTTILAVMLMVIHITKAQWVGLGENSNYSLNANNIIYSVVTDISGNVYAAGEFSFGDPVVRNYYVAKWTGDSAWVPLDTVGFKANSYIYTLATDPQGNIYAAGAFTDDTVILSAGDVYYYGHVFVAKYNGTNWTELGTNGVAPVPSVYGTAITSIALDASGNVYAAGEFTGGSNYFYVSKWNGTTWSELGTGTNALNANHFINTITTDPQGNVYAAGDFTDSTGGRYVAKWNGTDWSELGTGSNALNANSPIRTITTDLTGNLYVGYQDTSSDFYVAQWNGTNWNQVGTGSNALNANNSINTLTTDVAGNLYAAGNFTDINGTQFVAMWNGATWSELGTGNNILAPNGYILTIATDTALNVYAAGYFTDGYSKYYVAEYDPNTQIQSGISEINSAHLKVYPNPAIDAFDISILTEPESEYHVTLYDLAGRVVMEEDFSGASVTMQRGETDAGSYFIQVTDRRTSNTFQKRVVFE